MRYYETFATTADAGIRFRGRDFSELYANALRGLNLLLFGRNSPPRTGSGAAVPFRFRGDGPESILVNFLSEVLFQVYHEERRAAAIVIRRAGRDTLEAELLLVPCRKPPQVDVKSATYHNLRVEKRNEMLHAAIVFDI